jgi:enolase
MFNLLQGSKLVGSKCKIFKIYLIIDKYENGGELFEIVNQITQNLRKTITSTKLGEAALKYHNDNTILCVADTIAENLKMAEETFIKSNFKDKISMGISWQADLFYNPD